MTDTVITVTEAARRFADCVNRAHYQNTSFVLLKNGVPFARLIPAHEPICSGRVLADALDTVALSPQEARSWNRDLRAGRKILSSPREPWR